MVCITGSNGKTTPSLLTHHILRGAGIDAALAGNVGKSLAWQVARDPHPVYVVGASQGMPGLFIISEAERMRAVLWPPSSKAMFSFSSTSR